MANGDGTRTMWWRSRHGPGRGLRPVVLVLLIVTATVLAGCGALSGGSGADGDAGGPGDGAETTATATGTPDRLSTELSAPPEEIFERVEELIDAEAQSYPEVRVDDVDSVNQSETFFLQVVGPPANRSALESEPAVTATQESIVVDEDALAEGDGATIERQLVYSFAFHVARQNGVFSFPDRPHDWAVGRMSFWYVANAYAAEYRPAAEDPPDVPQGWGDTEYGWARVAIDYYAYQWIDDRVDSPSGAVGLILSDGPPSSEQFIRDTDDGPGELGLALETSEDWYRSEEQNFQTRGPVTTRAVLAATHDRDRADAAVDGWVQDRYFVVTALRGDDAGVVWTHRWDSEAEADEFADAMEAHLAQRRNETDAYRFELRRLASDVTLVVTGPASFVDATTVEYADGNVTASVGADA